MHIHFYPLRNEVFLLDSFIHVKALRKIGLGLDGLEYSWDGMAWAGRPKNNIMVAWLTGRWARILSLFMHTCDLTNESE